MKFHSEGKPWDPPAYIANRSKWRNHYITACSQECQNNKPWNTSCIHKDTKFDKWR